MSTKLDKILDSIDPTLTLDQVSARVDDAVNSFQVGTAAIDDWATFKAILTRFFRHVENFILQIKHFRSPNPDIDWGRCCRLLMQEFGPSGEKASFEMARTGKEGGIYAVLKAIAKRMIREYGQNEIMAKANTFWEGLTLDEKMTIPNEYLDKYGHLIPEELSEGTGVMVRANFPSVLKEHPNITSRLRNIGRKGN